MEFSVSTGGVPGNATLPRGFWSRAGARRSQGNLAHCWRSLDNCMALMRTLDRYRGLIYPACGVPTLMSQNHIGALNAGIMQTAMPAASNDVDFFPGMAQKWGLSFLINTQPGPAGRSAGSLAWAGAANTYFWIDPVKQVTDAILMQLRPFADEQAVKLYGQFESGVYTALQAA